MRSPEKNSVALWLAVLPGLLGLFGLGHLYLRKIERGLVFLAYTTTLFVILLISLLFQETASLLWMPTLPLMWFAGWAGSILDLNYLKKKERLIGNLPLENGKSNTTDVRENNESAETNQP